MKHRPWSETLDLTPITLLELECVYGICYSVCCKDQAYHSQGVFYCCNCRERIYFDTMSLTR